ncbi:hypothetical protein [Lysinibacillus xylanilyticus]|uniref:Uncharacterized protein n=1 Tax=Lysinibacillus xylanilyticus TaxID=582475 RepID=A0A2M9QA51_9BACI|nr:hypothetical protein [Lysinibacillus xylanilyticus]PJO44939.1 hypothetical protein CWD94_04440 [Lysinibacillus xylanilyticus]
MMLEIIVLMGIFLLLIAIGVLSALSESFSRKRESKWAFSSAGATEGANRTIQPVDEASSFGTTLVAESVVSDVQIENNYTIYKQIVNNNNLVDFSHSEITDEVSNNLNKIANAYNSEVNYYADSCNCSKLNNVIKDKIRELVGEKIAGLVTNLLTDLKKNELSVIMGLYNPEEHSITFEGTVLKLSTVKPIISGEEDYILLKGTLLSNGEFRVIHFDDAEMVEHGYGVESFVLEKTA